MVKKRSGRGGRRPGAGRKPMVPGEVRRNRVVVMLTDAQRAALSRLAQARGLPFGTVAYEMVARALGRAAAKRPAKVRPA